MTTSASSSGKRRLSKAVVLLVVAATAFALFYFRIFEWLTFENLKAHQVDLQARVAESPFKFSGLFFLIYVGYVALSLPGSVVLSLAAGSVFGTIWGSLLVSLASTMGATLAFWFARFVFRDFIQRHWQKRLDPIDESFRREGVSYLFTLRLVPLFPFFIINLAMGLTSIKTWTYFWVSQLGMLPVTILYVNAGTALGQIDSADDILSGRLALSLSLVGIVPLLIRHARGRPGFWKGWIVVGLILLTSASLRLTLAKVNYQSNDDHLSLVIRPILKGTRASNILSAYHPPLYHRTAAKLLEISGLLKPLRQAHFLQVVNSAVGFLALLGFLWFLFKEGLPGGVFLRTFSLAAFTPSLIAMSAQVTNDTFLFIFSAGAVLAALNLASRRDFSGRAPLVLAFLLATVFLAVATKGNGLVLGVTLAVGFFASLFFCPERPPRFLVPAGLIVLGVTLVGFLSFDVYRSHRGYQRVASDSKMTLGMFAATKIEDVSMGSPRGHQILIDAFLTFPYLQMLSQPSNVAPPPAGYQKLELLPPAMRSYWAQIFGRFSFSRFEYWPPAWRKSRFPILYLGRALLVANLLLVGLFIAGMWVMIKEWRLCAVTEQRKALLLFSLGFGFLAAGVRYYTVFPSPPFAKFIYIAPAVVSLFYFVNRAQLWLLRSWPTRANWILTSFFSVLALLNIMDIAALCLDLQ